MLKKENIIFKRDANEKLLPTIVKVPKLNEEIQFIPMCDGDVWEFRLKLDAHGAAKTNFKQAHLELLKKHLLDPKLEDAELQILHPEKIEWLVFAIFDHSHGLDPQKRYEHIKPKPPKSERQKEAEERSADKKKDGLKDT